MMISFIRKGVRQLRNQLLKRSVREEDLGNLLRMRERRVVGKVLDLSLKDRVPSKVEVNQRVSLETLKLM